MPIRGNGTPHVSLKLAFIPFAEANKWVKLVGEQKYLWLSGELLAETGYRFLSNNYYIIWFQVI